MNKGQSRGEAAKGEGGRTTTDLLLLDFPDALLVRDENWGEERVSAGGRLNNEQCQRTRVPRLLPEGSAG